jgi:hypothetical protein
MSKNIISVWHQWLMPVILATQEDCGWKPAWANSQDLISKSLHKNNSGGVAQGEGPEFKPQYHTQKKNIYMYICIYLYIYTYICNYIIFYKSYIEIY